MLNGGHLRPISPDPSRQSVAWSGYCDEEGKLKQLPVNAAAKVLAERFGWTPWRGNVLVGPVIFLGGLDADGYETDVPEELVAGPPVRVDVEITRLDRLKDATVHRQPPVTGVE